MTASSSRLSGMASDLHPTAITSADGAYQRSTDDSDSDDAQSATSDE